MGMKRFLALVVMVLGVVGCSGYDESSMRQEVEDYRGGPFSDGEWESVVEAKERECESEFIIESGVDYALREGEEGYLMINSIMVNYMCPEHMHYFDDALAEFE